MSKGVGPLRVLQIALQNGFQLISYGFLRGVAVCVGLLLTSAISADSNMLTGHQKAEIWTGKLQKTKDL